MSASPHVSKFISSHKCDKDDQDNFPDVKELTLQRKSIDSADHAFDRFPNLISLNLSRNNLVSLDTLGHLPSLQRLSLYYNRVTHVRDVHAICQACPKLENLDLRLNPITRSEQYRLFVIQSIPQLQVLDERPIRQFELNRLRELATPIVLITDGYESSSSSSSSSETPPPERPHHGDEDEPSVEQSTDPLVSPRSPDQQRSIKPTTSPPHDEHEMPSHVNDNQQSYHRSPERQTMVMSHDTLATEPSPLPAVLDQLSSLMVNIKRHPETLEHLERIQSLTGEILAGHYSQQQHRPSTGSSSVKAMHKNLHLENAHLQSERSQLAMEVETLKSENNRLAKENLDLRVECGTLKNQATSSPVNQDVVDMLREAHRALIGANKTLLAELDQTKKKHQQDEQRWQLNFEQLKAHYQRQPHL